MRVLILGGMTMIGHQVYHQLYREFPHLKAAFKQPLADIIKTGFFISNQVIDRIDFQDKKMVEHLLKTTNPDVVINAAGSSLPEMGPLSESEIIELHSALPYYLYDWCRKHGAFLIHFTSDEVFEGSDYPYTELSPTDSKSLFGRAMALGEIQGPSCLTLRTSVIGPSLVGHEGIYSRFSNDPNQFVTASRTKFISGVTSTYLAQFVSDQVRYGLPLEGLFNLASQPISEVELIRLINTQFRWNLKIKKEKDNDSNPINKILSNKKLLGRWPETSPLWSDMLYELHRTVLTSSAHTELQLAK